MTCSFNVIAVFVIMGSAASGQLEVAKDDNIEPFSLLCRIYNVAKNPPINHVYMEEGYNIVKEIDALNMSLLEGERIHEKEDAGNNSEAQVKPIVTRETALAQLSLNQITQKAHTIWGDINKINVKEEIEDANAEFNQVIFGEHGNESDLCDGALMYVKDRATACGKPGGGTKGINAGKSLVVDFFCLCARNPEEQGVNQVCGFYVGVKDSKIGWNESEPMGSSTMWASIKGGCGKHMQQHPKSIEDARHILDQFLKHLRTGGVYRWGSTKEKVDGSDRKEGMLGTGVGKKENGESGPVCNGKKGGKQPSSPGGVCVYYGQESEWNDIAWLKKIKTALNEVDALNNKTATIQRNIQKLQTLLHRAEQIYETAKVISDVQNPVLPTNLQAAAKRLTAYNAAPRHHHTHFILLFVLL